MGIVVWCEYRVRRRRWGLARELMVMTDLVCPSPLHPTTTQCRPILVLTAVSIERDGCLKRNLDRGDRGMCGTCTDALTLTTVFDRAFDRGHLDCKHPSTRSEHIVMHWTKGTPPRWMEGEHSAGRPPQARHSAALLQHRAVRTDVLSLAADLSRHGVLLFFCPFFFVQRPAPMSGVAPLKFPSCPPSTPPATRPPRTLAGGES